MVLTLKGFSISEIETSEANGLRYVGSSLKGTSTLGFYNPVLWESRGKVFGDSGLFGVLELEFSGVTSGRGVGFRKFRVECRGLGLVSRIDIDCGVFIMS